MSYVCTNDWVYTGDPGNPPEFRSTSPISCARCCAELDADDDDFHEVYGETVCGGCIESCSICGEWLDDATFPWKLDAKDRRKFIGGPIAVRFRAWENDGKLSAPHCPVCAGNWLLQGFTGVDLFNVDDYEGKEYIRLLLAANAALPGMAESEYLPVASRAEVAYAV